LLADLCGIMNCANNPRADGNCGKGSDERMMAEDYYLRVGYRFFRESAEKQEAKDREAAETSLPARNSD
jgi:hypothetical protein